MTDLPPPSNQPLYQPAVPSPPAARRRRVGVRQQRRPEARFSPAIATAGVSLVVAGVLIWSIGYFVAGFHLGFGTESDNFQPSTSGGDRRFLGAGLFLVLAVAGYGAVVVRRRGPLATAGVVAAAAGVPLALTFAFLDFGDVFTGQFPINIDAVILISILVWLASFFVVPGAKGRSVYLGLTALFLYGYVAFKVDGTSLLQSGVTISGSGSGNSGGITGSSSSVSGFLGSGSGGVTALGLVFGLGYYAVAAFLDRRGRAGAATAFVFAAFGATVSGLVSAASSFGQIGIGLTLIVLCAALAWYGGFFGRRFTTWIWAAGFALGVGVIVDKITPHSYTGGGILLIVLGLVVATGAAVVASVTHEPLDIDDTDSPAVHPAAPTTQPGAAEF